MARDWAWALLLVDNGGEFANKVYLNLAENFNVEVVHTAAESPWQNGICERNHATVDACVSKLLEDGSSLPLDVALAWAVNAKNAMKITLVTRRINSFSHGYLTFLGF